MQYLAMILVGLVVGVVARLVMVVVPGKDPPGAFFTILAGIGGSLLAGRLGWSTEPQGPGLISSVLGALILIALTRILTYRIFK